MSDYDEAWFIKQRLYFRKTVRSIRKSARMGVIGWGQQRIQIADAFISAFKKYPRRMRKGIGF